MDKKNLSLAIEKLEQKYPEGIGDLFWDIANQKKVIDKYHCFTGMDLTSKERIFLLDCYSYDLISTTDFMLCLQHESSIQTEVTAAIIEKTANKEISPYLLANYIKSIFISDEVAKLMAEKTSTGELPVFFFQLHSLDMYISEEVVKIIEKSEIKEVREQALMFL